MIVRIPRIIKRLYPRRTWEGPAKGKKIYLTFDDGPIPEVTPWVLQQLRSYGAKATFFCIGDNIRKHPELLEQVISEGHSAGNHTYHHLNGWKTSVTEYLKNTGMAKQVLDQHLCETGDPSEEKKEKKALFRPPYGRIKNGQARALEKAGYRIVMWDIISMDFDPGTPPQRCYHNVIDNARSGSIIVFHDSLKAAGNLKIVLPKILEHYSRKGFSFEKL